MKIMAHRRGDARITDSSIISLNELPKFHSLKERQILVYHPLVF